MDHLQLLVLFCCLPACLPSLLSSCHHCYRHYPTQVRPLTFFFVFLSCFFPSHSSNWMSSSSSGLGQAMPGPIRQLLAPSILSCEQHSWLHLSFLCLSPNVRLVLYDKGLLRSTPSCPFFFSSLLVTFGLASPASYPLCNKSRRPHSHLFAPFFFSHFLLFASLFEFFSPHIH